VHLLSRQRDRCTVATEWSSIPWHAQLLHLGIVTRALVVIGSGSLARAFCYSLAVSAGAPEVLWLVGRTPSALAEIAYVSTTRASAAGNSLVVNTAPVDTIIVDAITEVLRREQPAAVLLCASYQSPWERDSAPSDWTRLIDRAGFGVTLPLQAAVAIEVARAVAAACPDALLINACFPDAVNPLLRGLGLPVDFGIGNVALLAASLAAALGLAGGRQLRVLAHHVHLHAPDDARDEARAWLGDVPVPDVTALLAAQRAASRAELNHVTGLAAARLLTAVLAGERVAASLPGPLGLPGGYPVVIDRGRVRLALPPQLPVPAAVSWNEQAARRDGVLVGAGRATFAPAAANALRPHLPDLADGFDLDATGAAADQLLGLRAGLRLSRPPPVVSAHR